MFPNPAFRRCAATLIVLALALAACTSSPQVTGAPPPAAAAVGSTIASTETPLPATTNTPFVPKATVKIFGEALGSSDINRGAELAVRDLADPLKQLGYAASFTAFDDQDNVDLAVKNVKAIIADPAYLCGAGPYTSRVTLNVMSLFHRAGLAFITPSATNPQVTGLHYIEVNRATGRDDVQGSVALAFARDKGAGTAYIVRTGQDFFNRVASAFKSGASKTELKVIGDGTSSGNNQTLVGKIVAAKPDLVFFTGFSAQAGPFFNQVRAAGYEGMLLSADGAPGLGESAGPLAQEGGGTYYFYASTPIQANAAITKFAEDFTVAYDAPPQLYAAAAYDAAGICLKAIEEAVKAKGGELPTRAEVAKAIRALQNYPGITQTFTFDQDGDPLLTDYYVMQLANLDQSSWGKNPVGGMYPLPPPP